MKNICCTCFSHGRQLFALKKMQWLIHETCLSELFDAEDGICWECHSIIMKFFKFKSQVKKAQMILKQNMKPQDLKPLSALSSTTKYIYDYEFHHTDPLSSVDTDNKDVPIKLKDLIREDTSDDELVTKEDIFVEPCKHDDVKLDLDVIEEVDAQENVNPTSKTERVKSVKKVKKIKADTDDEIREKFDRIVLTEEEMVKNREEKRRQPNFKKIPYKCDTCVLGFTRRENYDLHMDKKHDEKIGSHICPVCHIRFQSRKQADRHQSRHYVCYRCRLCKYTTVELWSAVNHCRVKHSGDARGKIHCQQCTYVASSPEDLSQHQATEHTVLCNECGEKFKGQNTLRTHKIRIHATDRQFACTTCGKTFSSQSRLESHAWAHGASAHCVPCGRQYKHLHAYRTHLRTSKKHAHTPYPCPECNKKFASKVYWKKHYNFYHLRISQFHCQICNKLFISDWRLKNHRQKHHGLARNRDHSCNICSKRFYTSSTLRSHQLTHSEQRLYMCAQCGDTFKQRPALYTHSRLLHSETT